MGIGQRVFVLFARGKRQVRFVFEFKWQKKRVRIPKSWLEGYKGSSFELVNKENWQEFVIVG